MSNAVIFDDATPGANRNVVGNYPSWVGTVGVATRSIVDNTKKGIVNLAWDDNTDAPQSDAYGCTADYTTAFGLMPSVTGQYAGGGGYRANAYGTGAWCFGYSVFADGDGCFAMGHRTVAGAAPIEPGGQHDYATAWGDNCQAKGNGSTCGGIGSKVDNIAANGVAIGFGCHVTISNGVSLGNQCEANADGAVSIGTVNVGNGVSGTAFGKQNTITSAASFAFAVGTLNNVSGVAASAIGLSNTNAGRSACSFGESNTVGSNARYAFVHGRGGTANRRGEYVHAVHDPANGPGGAFKRNLLVGTSANGGTVNLLDEGGAELAVDNLKSYLVRVFVLGSRTDAAGRGAVVRTLLAHASGGTLVIDDNGTTDYNQLAAGWGVTLSAPSGLTLRIACNGATGQTVKFAARVEWTELEGV